MKITKTRLKQIIKEELQVVLTNEEVEEMFGEEVRAQVEAMEEELDERKNWTNITYEEFDERIKNNKV